MHPSFIHVVLSLLLLVSQQLGLMHVTEHMTSSRNSSMLNVAQLSVSGSEVRKAEKPAQVLLDVSCDQCSAFAQLATALPVVVPSPPPVLPASFIAGANQAHSICSQTQCVYQSRAPPVLA